MNTTTPVCENYDDFRAKVRSFVENSLPSDIRDSVAARGNVSRDQAMRWQKILHRAGWGAPGWPTQFGGTGWPLTKQAVLLEALALAGAPATENLGLMTIGPTIIRHGTPEQHARFLPGIIAFDDFWAQAYSEPGSGSDLASLKCSARRNGDHYIVNGTKIWQSHAHWANRALTLVRVDNERPDGEQRRKQDGITVLLIDLKAPGVTVRPIRFMHGRLFHSQIFFDDVRVPVANRLGSEGAGWAVAKDLLVVERLFGGRVAECRDQLDQLKELARGHGPCGGDLQCESWFARRVAELEMRLQAYHAAWWSAVAGIEAGENLDIEVSKLRLIGTVLLQDIFGLQLEAAGPHGLLAPPVPLTGEDADNEPALRPDHAERLHIHHFRHRGITLGAGSAEVQREIIARDVFNRGGPGDRAHFASADQQLLAETVTRFLERNYSFERRRDIVTTKGSFDPDIWQGFAEIGILGLLVPVDADGFGGTVCDLAIVAEAMGRTLVVEPLFWTAVAAATFAGRATVEQAGLLVAKMMAGEQRVALAYLEADARFDPDRCATTARAKGDHWVIDGHKVLVWGADSADCIIISARIDSSDGELGLFCLDRHTAQLVHTSYQVYDGRAAADITCRAVVIPGCNLLLRGKPAETALHGMLDIITLMTAAQAIGAMDQGLAITVDYMKTRQQFGHPIADFQALRHRVAEHCLALYNVRSMVRFAAAARGPEASRAVAAAKWMAGRAARQIGHDILQLHGAIGFQDETPISHYAKHLIAADATLGDSEYQMTRWLRHDNFESKNNAA